jgi:hypothetical protein
MYHRILRISALVFACVLVFESGLISDTTSRLSTQTHSYLANAIGVGASVQPTELNRYTAQLTQRERELDAREEAIAQREIEVELAGGPGGQQNETATYLLASILFILLLLILLNYVLDYLRIKEAKFSARV